MNKQEEQLVDSSVRDVLKNARIVQEMLTKEEKEKMEIRRQKKAKNEQDVLSYLESIGNSSDRVILRIVQDIIYTYCSIKYDSIVKFTQLPEKVTITSNVTTKELPSVLSTYINSYLEGVNCDNDEINQRLKNISLSNDKVYKIIYGYMPLVQFKPEKDSKYEPALYDKDYISQLGFDFQPIPRTSTMGVEIEFSKLEEFINNFLNGTIDLSAHLTEKEIKDLKEYIESVHKTERKMNSFFERCNKGLQKIIPDITKGLLADLEKKKNNSFVGEYKTSVPFYITSHTFFKDSHPFKAEHNFNVREFLKDKANKRDLEMSNWLWDITKFRDYVCYYPYKNKNGNVTYYPILYKQLMEIFARYGITSEIKANEVDRNKFTVFYMNNELAVVIKAKDFRRFVNMILGNSSEDEDEINPDTKQQHI